MAAYTLLVGADPAVARAALMGGLALFARQVGRRQAGLNSLAFVALLWRSSTRLYWGTPAGSCPSVRLSAWCYTPIRSPEG